MFTLGISPTLHDGAAALVHNGCMLVFVEQERVSRHKRAYMESPVDAIASCLAYAGVTLDDIDAVSIGWNNPVLNVSPEKFTLESYVEWLLPTAKLPRSRRPHLHFVPHHLAHAASAFFTSGFDEALVLVIDGNGETQSTTLAIARLDGIKVIREWDITQSLGNFYAAATQWAGLSYMDAGKFMGLASYGQPRQSVPLIPASDGYTFMGGRHPHRFVHRHQLQQCVALYKHFRNHNYPFSQGTGKDIMLYATFAASIQAALEAAVFQILREGKRQTGLNKLVFAGGVALNCTLNGKLARSEIFDDIFIPPIPHDAGTSLGAAFLAEDTLGGLRHLPSRLSHAYWGINPTNDEIRLAIDAAGLPATKMDEHDLAEAVASHLVAGHIVGWFQGRAEIGPRALGARSMLCDPRHRRLYVRLNELKGRELWRPLAPSVLAEHVEDIFNSSLPAAADFMLAACSVPEDVQPAIPAAVHIDGTSRPQIVRQSTNPRFWQVIECFRQRSGCPAIINTSFNLAGEPIVHTPADAISVFTRSDIDVLAIGDYLIVKNSV